MLPTSNINIYSEISDWELLPNDVVGTCIAGDLDLKDLISLCRVSKHIFAQISGSAKYHLKRFHLEPKPKESWLVTLRSIPKKVLVVDISGSMKFSEVLKEKIYREISEEIEKGFRLTCVTFDNYANDNEYTSVEDAKDFFNSSFNGNQYGTNFSNAFDKIKQIYDKNVQSIKNTEVILISDFDGHLRKMVEKVKACSMHIRCVVVPSGNQSNHSHLINDLEAIRARAEKEFNLQGKAQRQLLCSSDSDSESSQATQAFSDSDDDFFTRAVSAEDDDEAINFQYDEESVEIKNEEKRGVKRKRQEEDDGRDDSDVDADDGVIFDFPLKISVEYLQNPSKHVAKRPRL